MYCIELNEKGYLKYHYLSHVSSYDIDNFKEISA